MRDEIVGMLAERIAPEPIRPLDHYLNLKYGILRDLTTSQLLKLCAVVTEIGAERIVELGTRRGVSTAALCHAADSIPNARVFAVEKRWPQPFLHDRLVFIEGDDTDAETAAQVPDEIDVLFIDTSHEINHTRAELALYGERVREGGAIICHDTELYGVMSPLFDFFAQHGGTFELDTSGHGLGVLRR